MRLFILTLLVALAAGCSTNPPPTPKYKCTAGDQVYYADHFTAIVITDEVVLLGDCKEQ